MAAIRRNIAILLAFAFLAPAVASATPRVEVQEYDRLTAEWWSQWVLYPFTAKDCSDEDTLRPRVLCYFLDGSEERAKVAITDDYEWVTGLPVAAILEVGGGGDGFGPRDVMCGVADVGIRPGAKWVRVEILDGPQYDGGLCESGIDPLRPDVDYVAPPTRGTVTVAFS